MRSLRSLRFSVLLLGVVSAVLPAQEVAYASAGAVRIGVLSGIVRDTLGMPVPYASVFMEGGAMVVANDSGLFRLDGLAPGRGEFGVRRIGYAPVYFALHVLPDTTIYVSVQLRPVVHRIRTVTVEEKRLSMNLNRVGFYARAEEGWGTFLFPTDIADRQPQTVADLLHGITGIELEARWGGSVHVIGANGCVLNVFLDGLRYRHGNEGIGSINPGDIRAMEIYPRPGTTPVQFRTGDRGTCGSLVLWTKID